MARVLALACAARAFSPAAGGAARPRAGPLSLFGLGGGDSRYGALVADVAAYEARAAPAVAVAESPGAGRGVFAARDVRAGETLTEYVRRSL